jgi:hypothetical protein
MILVAKRASRLLQAEKPIKIINRILVGLFVLSTNTNLSIAHNLKTIPRAIHVLYSYGIFTPKWKAYQAWDTVNIYIQLDTTVSSPNFVTILIH